MSNSPTSLPLRQPRPVSVESPEVAPGTRTRSRLTALRAEVRHGAINHPGIYRMIGEGGEILYVGKSIRLRTRLLSYFRARPGEKAAELIRSTERITWDHHADEFSAVVTEMKLIQRFRPRFNVEHKRKRRFAFVRITGEAAPRLVLAGRIQGSSGQFFGPFPSGARVQEALRELSHVLGIRDCPASTRIHFGGQLEMLPVQRPPLCLRGDLGSCPAPCSGGCSDGQYRERVERARAFLEGRSTEVFTRLDEVMREAAARHDYEYAAFLRDRSQRLRRLQEELVAFRGSVESLSFVYRPKGYSGAKRLYLIRKGRIRAELPWPRNRRERLRAARVIDKAWSTSEAEAESRALEPDDAAEIFLVASWFRQRPEEWERTVPTEDFLLKSR